ncbi:agmatinase [Pikeienuella piscinae]|uniref:Agmatinase n=1 Tax=Pikeienuella piscinae TaxID=2748098 RepID=A0A7L5BXU8_9RHOB|nr:agmatinase [Pikeienuella piscinae]QIE56261.1 agmatinase [Pikeienuella piscinae]
MTAHRKDYAFTAGSPKQRTHDEAMYSGALSFCRRAYARDLAGVDLAVMGVPFDTSVTNRPGARFGPRAVRAASSNLAWSRAWPSPFDPFERLSVVDWGDIAFDPGRPERVPAAIEAAIGAVIAEAGGALLLGGDHFTTYPSLKAHASKHGAPLALIQFDAHTDTWPDDEPVDGPDAHGRIDHGTMFWRAARERLIDPAHSVQVGIRTTNDDTLGMTVLDATWCHERLPADIAAEIRRVVGDRPAYLSFDIDGLDPSCAPGTGTPVVGGLFTWQALTIIRALKGIDLVGMDVVEVAPAYDHAEITALAAATIALELICLYAGAR